MDQVKHVQNFASILTQTQTKALILWREKEFVRAFEWATYIEKLFVQLNHEKYLKIINMMDQPLPIVLKLSLEDFQQARLLFIRYVLHSDYIDLNLGDILVRAIDTYKYFKNGKIIIQKLIDERIKTEKELYMANSFLNLTKDMLSQNSSSSSTVHSHSNGGNNSPNCIKLFDKRILTSNSTTTTITTTTSTTMMKNNSTDKNNNNIPPVINVLSKNKYIDINDTSYADCIGIFILKQYHLWNRKKENLSSSLDIIDENNYSSKNNNNAKLLLKSFTEIFALPLSNEQNDGNKNDNKRKTLPLCNATIASTLSDAYFPFARAYISELVHAAIELSNGTYNTNYVQSSMNPILSNEIRPRFQHLMNHSERLKLLCKSMLQELVENGVDDAVAILS